MRSFMLVCCGCLLLPSVVSAAGEPASGPETSTAAPKLTATGLLDEAFRLSDSASFSPGRAAQELARIAVLQGKGKRGAALVTLGRAIAQGKKETGKDHDPAWTEVALAQAQLDHPDEALEALERVRTSGEELIGPLEAIVHAYSRAKPREPALATLKRLAQHARRLPPHSGRFTGLLAAAGAAHRLGEKEQAGALYHEASAVIREHSAPGGRFQEVEWYLWVARLQQDAGLTADAAASRSLAEPIARELSDAFSFQRVAEAHRRAGDAVGMAAALRAADASRPRGEGIESRERHRMERSGLHAELGFPARALELARGLEQPEFKATALTAVARAEVKAGRAREALEIAAETLPVARTIPDGSTYQSREGALLALAEVRIDAGARAAGLETLSEARSLIEARAPQIPELSRARRLAIQLARVGMLQAKGDDRKAATATLARARAMADTVPLSAVTRGENPHPLLKVAEALAAQGDYAPALASAEALRDDRFHTRDVVFSIVARAQAAANHPETLATTRKIGDPGLRMRILQSMADALQQRSP